MPMTTDVRYNGLRNQGSTCYLNSVLQVLFMTDDFREAVERYHENECIDLQLKRLFGKLRDHTTDTFDITNKLGIRRVYEQQDAAEYYEKILNLTSNEASQIFHGELTHRTTCSGCNTHTGRDGRFWHLPLTLVDSSGEYNVVSGIQKYFMASTFSGDNQMYCEQCDDKRDATMQFVIKHHPEVLMLLLKRFELDYGSMTYIKINATVLIPYTLQIPENQTYELYAVVDHFGDLRSGHYSACIRSQEDDRWFRFDDAWVTELGYQPFQLDNFESSHSAYLLFYRKKSAPAADTESPEDIREESAPGGCPPSTSHVEEPQDGVMVNGEVKVEETAEPEIDIKVDEKDRVSVSSEEEVKLPEPRRHVEDLENRDHPMQGNHEENNESNDSYLQLQDKKDEVKAVPDNEEVFRRREGAEKRKVMSRESLSEENTMRQVRPQEVCVDVQIENKEKFMEDKRDEDKDERKEKIGTGRHQDNEGKEVEPEVRQEGGEDTKRGERRAEGAEVKSGTDKVESRNSQPLRNPVEKIQDDVRVSKGTQNMRKDAESQVKRGHSDCTQDRNKSSRSRLAPVWSSFTEGQGQVKKKEKQTKSDEGIMQEKQQSKETGTCKEEEKKGTHGIRKRPGLEEITLETTSSRKRKRKNLSGLFCGLSLSSKAKKVKIEPETETPEQVDVVKHEKKKRWSKRSKEKTKQGKTTSCFSFSRKNQNSETESDSDRTT